MTDTKKQWVLALVILLVFILLWIFLYFMMRKPVEKQYDNVSQVTFETRLKNIFTDIQGEKQDDYTKYAIDEHSEVYVNYKNNNISKLLLVFDYDNYEEEKAKGILQEMIDICIPKFEQNEEVATTLMDLKGKENQLVANDMVFDNIEFFSRIDREKNKIVFYIYYLDNE